MKIPTTIKKRDIYLRKIEPFMQKTIVKVLTGHSRVGKSYILYQLIEQITKTEKNAIEADRDYACMFFANGTKEDVFERLGEIEKKLPATTFIRTGKSVIINRNYIHKITDAKLQLVTSATNYFVDISKEAMRQLKENL